VGNSDVVGNSDLWRSERVGRVLCYGHVEDKIETSTRKIAQNALSTECGPAIDALLPMKGTGGAEECETVGERRSLSSECSEEGSYLRLIDFCTTQL